MVVPSVVWTASVLPRRSGSAAFIAPTVSEALSSIKMVPYSASSAVIAQNGRAETKPISAASSVDASMTAISTGRRPRRTAASLPSTLATMPSSRIPLAAVVIVASPTLLA